MSARKLTGTFAAIILIATTLAAKDFWENPFDKWGQNDVIKMLSDSPWGMSNTVTSASLQKSANTRGENETYYKFTVRFFSALPIREAYVQMQRMRNNYYAKTAAEKQEIDARFNKPLTLDFSDKIVVALDYTSTPNDANFIRDIKNFMDTATVDNLKQNVYLITKDNGRIDLKEFYRPGQMMPSAVFVFPRVIEGKPVVSADDKEVRFQIGWLPGANQQIYFDFKPSKMLYKGKLEL